MLSKDNVEIYLDNSVYRIPSYTQIVDTAKGEKRISIWGKRAVQVLREADCMGNSNTLLIRNPITGVVIRMEESVSLRTRDGRTSMRINAPDLDKLMMQVRVVCAAIRIKKVIIR